MVWGGINANHQRGFVILEGAVTSSCLCGTMDQALCHSGAMPASSCQSCRMNFWSETLTPCPQHSLPWPITNWTCLGQAETSTTAITTATVDRIGSLSSGCPGVADHPTGVTEVPNPIREVQTSSSDQHTWWPHTFLTLVIFKMTQCWQKWQYHFWLGSLF